MNENSTRPQILAVDDTLANLQILVEMLGGEGYKVRVAQDGPSALESVRTQAPDLVLLDVRMPDMDGLEVCRRLKSDAALQEIPVIFLSAANESEDILNGFKAGGADYVVKPFQSEELLARVRAHLEIVKGRIATSRLVHELQEALEQVKTLSGLVPICGSCKKIRDDQGFWNQMEVYIEAHSEAKFSHGICPECMARLYPELADRVRAKRDEPSS